MPELGLIQCNRGCRDQLQFFWGSDDTAVTGLNGGTFCALGLVNTRSYHCEVGLGPIFCFWGSFAVMGQQGTGVREAVKNSVIKLTQLVTPTVEALGLQLWGLEHTAKGKCSVLRIFIDCDSGVTIEDCEQVSRQVSALLDVEDPIVGEYTLEVSSPGTDRLLFTVEQFLQYRGEEVSIRMRSSIDGRRKFKGILQDVVSGVVHIEVDGSSFELLHRDIEKANIVY